VLIVFHFPIRLGLSHSAVLCYFLTKAIYFSFPCLTWAAHISFFHLIVTYFRIIVIGPIKLPRIISSFLIILKWLVEYKLKIQHLDHSCHCVLFVPWIVPCWVTFNIFKGLIKRWRTIDRWRSRWKGWFHGPLLIHTYIHAYCTYIYTHIPLN
jgi:hypothetical protein